MNYYDDLIARLGWYPDGIGNTIRKEAADAIEALAKEHAEDQSVIAVWRGRTERAEAERDEARGWAQHWQAEAAEDGAALQAAEAERDAAVALLREARAMIVRLEQALGHEGLIVDIPDPVPSLITSIDALLADKEGTT